MTILKIKKLFNILRSPFFLNALVRHGVAASTEHHDVLSQFSFTTIVDIGANRGQFGLVVKKIFPQSKLISFEPLPLPATIFRKLFLSDIDVTLYQVAIGEFFEIMQINVSAKDDSSSLLPITKLQTKTFPGTCKVSTTSVKVAPLDNFLSATDIVGPALLKLDVQGYEYEAIKGCRSLLKFFDYVYCECSFIELYLGQKLASDVIVQMKDEGYSLLGIFNTTYNNKNQAVQADFLFSR